MNKGSSGIGCLILFLVFAIAATFQWVSQNPAGIFIIIGAVVAIVFAFRASKRNKFNKVADSFSTVADQLEALAKTNDSPANISLTLKKGEKALFALYNTSLIEYQSTGSTFSGVSGGIGVPITDSLSGYVGGTSGSIIENPEELSVIDTGTAVYTTQRIVFTGSSQVRDWEFSKVVSLELGTNGQDVKIAVSNRDRISGLQTPFGSFGAGYPAGYAQTWFEEGEDAARKWLLKSAKELRAAVEELRTSQNPKAEISK